MPRKLPRACRHPGCPALTTDGLCPAHLKVVRTHATDRASVNPARQDSKRFYHSRQWKELRARVLKAQPFCRCGAQATTVDHIRAINLGGNPISETNLQPICNYCHAVKRRDEAAIARGQANQVRDSLLPSHLRKDPPERTLAALRSNPDVLPSDSGQENPSSSELIKNVKR